MVLIFAYYSEPLQHDRTSVFCCSHGGRRVIGPGMRNIERNIQLGAQLFQRADVYAVDVARSDLSADVFRRGRRWGLSERRCVHFRDRVLQRYCVLCAWGLRVLPNLWLLTRARSPRLWRPRRAERHLRLRRVARRARAVEAGPHAGDGHAPLSGLVLPARRHDAPGPVSVPLLDRAGLHELARQRPGDARRAGTMCRRHSCLSDRTNLSA